MDLTHVLDPGVILDPPSLSFGMMKDGDVKALTFEMVNISGAEERYELSTLYTGDGYDATMPLSGCEVTPRVMTLAPDQSAEVTVTFDSAQAASLGDNQGYLILAGDMHEAHLPVWARIAPAVEMADVLLIDNDLSTITDLPDYSGYYTGTLEAMNLSYSIWDADSYFANPVTIPPAEILAGFKAVIYFTGDNYYPDGYFTVSTPLTELDSNILTEYANGGGTLIVMGQDVASVMASMDPDNAFFLYSAVLGAKFLQDSITGSTLPVLPILATSGAPMAFGDLSIACTEGGDGAANQFYIDEIALKPEKDPDMPEHLAGFIPVLKYAGNSKQQDGVVAMAHRDQPSLEKPGVTYLGRSIYATFGLEGVNSDTGTTTRHELLERFLDWAWDEPTVAVEVVDLPNASGLTTLKAVLQSDDLGLAASAYRWDFGDGTPIMGPYASKDATHNYRRTGLYRVRVEATDAYGNVAIGSEWVQVTQADLYQVPLPAVFKG